MVVQTKIEWSVYQLSLRLNLMFVLGKVLLHLEMSTISGNVLGHYFSSIIIRIIWNVITDTSAVRHVYKILMKFFQNIKVLCSDIHEAPDITRMC